MKSEASKRRSDSPGLESRPVNAALLSNGPSTPAYPNAEGRRVIRGARGDAGFFLVDLLIYIALLGLIMAFALSAFLKCLSGSRDMKRNADNVLAALHAGERWRADIRGAVQPPKIVVEGNDNALEIPGGDGLIVYLFHNGAIWRRETEQAEWELVLPNVKSSIMRRTTRRHVAAWDWEIELKPRKQIVRVPPLFSFVAVARADMSP